MNTKFFKIPVFIYFIIATLIIILLFPKLGKFHYNFVEGRPWQHGLLTAPFDFPIYKTDQEIAQEKDTILKNFTPYFQYNAMLVDKEMARFDEKYNNLIPDFRTPQYRNYVLRVVKEIYKTGIISQDDLQFLQENNYWEIRVLKDNIAHIQPVKELFTIRSAYDYLLQNLPVYLDANVLSSMNLNDYLQVNLHYDEETSENVKSELLSLVSPSNGMVQAGEKIIDRGEIVEKETYNILRSLKIISEQRGGDIQHQTGTIIGISMLVGILMLSFFLYFYYLRKSIYNRAKDVFFVLFILLLFTVLTELCITYSFFNVYIIPYAMIPLVIRTFFDSRTAQMTHLITTFLCSLMLSLPFEFILMQSIVCMIAIYVLKDLTQRSQLIKCSFYILLAYLLVYISLLLFQDGDLKGLNWLMILYLAINFIFIMFTYPFIYILEKIFGYISNVTLVELSDINTPLLQMLSEKAPGTFQHSLQVSMLGTAAAVKVGANPQLIRTGALYHDVGKMTNPGFFIENKMGGIDPHQQLQPDESARIITSHVPDGVKMAEQYNIPKAIIKFIETHHGTGKAKYFYNTFKNQHPDEEIDEKAFSYSGMNPDTKETAILMMADAVEASSRSLADYSEESIRKHVNRIIDTQIADGLLLDTPLTFKDITKIKNVFIEKLISIYHTRISYPELNTIGKSAH